MAAEVQIASWNDLVKRNYTLRGMIDTLEDFPLNHHVDGTFSVTNLMEEGGFEPVGFSLSISFFGPDRNDDPDRGFYLEYELSEKERFLHETNQVRDVIYSKSITFKFLFDYYEGEIYSFDEHIGQYVFKYKINKEIEQWQNCSLTPVLKLVD